MNGAQEKARLEEERRRQEVRVLCVASSLTLGSNWQLAKRWEGVASFVGRKRRRSREPAQRKRQSWGKSEAPHLDPLQGSTHYRLCCKRQENARLEEERQRQEVPCKTAVFTLVV